MIIALPLEDKHRICDEPSQTCSLLICYFYLFYHGQANNKIGIMSDLAQSYILNYLRDGTAVSIVSFDSISHLLAPMTEITNSGVRANLAAKIPTKTFGGTGIGEGLDLCQQVRNATDGIVLIFC